MQLGRRIGRSGMTKPAHWPLPSSLLYPSHALRCTPHNSLVPALYPSRRANSPVVLCRAPCLRVLGSFLHTRRPRLCTARLSSRLLHLGLDPTNPLPYPFPTNVGIPTCPAFWLRLSRLSLSTLFPEKKLRPSLRLTHHLRFRLRRPTYGVELGDSFGFRNTRPSVHSTALLLQNCPDIHFALPRV